MTRFSRILFFLFGLSILSSCDNELQLLAEWKDIPVVYGVLSRQDTAHYVRVEKAFLDAEKSAYQVAQIPDSLYYDENEIVVQIRNLATGKTFTLNRVDGEAEGYPRDEGVFANQPNYLYKFKTSADEELNEGAILEFILQRGPGKDTVLARDVVVSDLKIREPYADGDILDLIPESRTQRVRWRSDDDAAIFNVTMIIKYKELNPDSGVWENKKINWVMTSKLPNEEGDGATLEFTGLQFFQVVGSRIDASIQRQRIFDRIDIQVEAGSPELANYISILQTSTGITSAEVVPNYSNLSEGYGIFATRNKTLIKDLFISGTSMDSLRNGRFTGDLNFQ